jgi:hypothetical protein
VRGLFRLLQQKPVPVYTQKKYVGGEKLECINPDND